MAILIKSKNIYDIEYTPLSNNKISEISVDYNNNAIINELDVEVYSRSHENSEGLAADGNAETEAIYKTYTIANGHYLDYYTSVAFLNITPAYYSLALTIPRHSLNYSIEEILGGDDISISISGNIMKGRARGVFRLDTIDNPVENGAGTPNLSSFENINITYETVPQKTDVIFSEIPTSVEVNFESSINTNINFSKKLTLKNNRDDVSSAKATYDPQGDFYRLDLVIFSGAETITMTGEQKASYHVDGEYWSDAAIVIVGDCYKYIPTSITFSIKGQKLSLKISDEKIAFKGNNEKGAVISFEKNEFLQKQNKLSSYFEQSLAWGHINITSTDNSTSTQRTFNISVDDFLLDIPFKAKFKLTSSSGKTSEVEFEFDKDNKTKSYNVELADYPSAELSFLSANFSHLMIYKLLIQGFATGKKIVTVLCDINDYYDEVGNRIVSPEGSKKLFEIGDICVPYVYNSKGEDEPLSVSANGLASAFKVCSARQIFDGAVWQELTMREWGEVVVDHKLRAPMVALNGDILTITDESGLAEEFDILIGGTVTSTTSATSVDLSTLGLSVGTHTITAKAKANGYNDSTESNAVSYTVEGEVEQTYTLSGTWYFENITPLKVTAVDELYTYNVRFTSGGDSFYAMRSMIFTDNYTENSRGFKVDWVSESSLSKTIFNGDWQDELYRTITFDGEQTVTKEFFEWFTANATITFTIDGVTYYAENGMTWKEWCESEYNTGRFSVIEEEGGECVLDEDGNFVCDANSMAIEHIMRPSDVIIAGYAYYIVGEA